jgi:hypothetical protein
MICVVKAGKIVETVKPGALHSKKGLYYNLANASPK